jgi:hypothetical protein
MTAHAADKPSTAMPSFFVTTVGPRGRAPLKPGIVGVPVPAMARHVPEKRKPDDLYEVRRGR